MAVAALAVVSIPAQALPVTTKTLTAKSATYDISVAYPQTGVKAIDDDLAAWAKTTLDDFRKEATTDHMTGDVAYMLEVTCTVPRNDAQVFAILCEEYTDTGGAHPNHDFYTANYLLPDGWHIYLPELLDGSRGLKRISDLARADLDKRITTGPEAMSDPDSVKSGTEPWWDNFRDFVLMPNAIALSFPPYQVASYAAGPQDSRIPLAALRDVMRPNTRAPAASFDCAAARTQLEQAICSDVALARLDRQVAETYATHMRDNAAAPNTANATNLRTNQRAWLAKRDQTCNAAANKAVCLTGFYKDRLAWLGHQP
jgi:uncharacterized protein YecT (DUF1311 family)